MYIRKLVKAGIASHTVSLPVSWIKKNKLTKGDIVYILEEEDNSLRVKINIKQKTSTKKEKIIKTEKKDTGTIQREITSAYLNNYNQITISGKDLNKKADSIRQMLHNFVALEIVEQTSNHIIAKDMLNLQEVSINKIIRRMDMILRSMLLDIISGVKDAEKTLEHRDCDMNRLYFLLFRLLKQASGDDIISATLGLNRTQILGKWYLTLNLENLADNGKKINLLVEKLNKKEFLEFKNSFSAINQNYLAVMKSYFTNDKKSADLVAKKRKETEDLFNKLLKPNKGNNLIVNMELIEILKTMSTLITNISRIIIDEEVN